MNLTTEENGLVWLAIATEASRILKAYTALSHSEVQAHKGRAFSGLKACRKQIDLTLYSLQSYREVKKGFSPAVDGAEKVSSELKAASAKWEKVDEILKSIKRPNSFALLWEKAVDYTRPENIPASDEVNGFEVETPSLIATLLELRVAYENTEKTASELLAKVSKKA